VHLSSMDKMSQSKEGYLSGKAHEPLKILDIGSQDVNGSYRELFDSPRWQHIGADMVPGKKCGPRSKKRL
jgi:hypothetical protein